MKLLAILFSISTILAYSQQEPEDLRSSITLSIYNPTSVPLTLIIRARQPSNGLLGQRFHQLAPLDTTLIKEPISLAENHVPQDEYVLSIFEAPDYYQISDHYYWSCSRIKDEAYECLHIIESYIIIDSIKFDSAAYVKAEQRVSPIYQDFEVEEMAEAEIGDYDLMLMAADSIGLTADSSNVNIYVQLVVEIDGTVSDVEILKTSDDSYSEKTEAFFMRQKFVPGIRRGILVRSKVVLPIRNRPQ